MTPPADVSRRTFLVGASAVVAASGLADSAHASAAALPSGAESVDLHWLDGAPVASVGSHFGVPWPRGAVPADSKFRLTTSEGDAPAQSWPLAYWPDGSLKWSGHAVPSAVRADQLTLVPGQGPAEPEHPVRVSRRGAELSLSNGVVDIRVATRGRVAISSIRRDGRQTARDGVLVLLLQSAPEDARPVEWLGVVESVETEKSGPVLAVVRLSGHYQSHGGRRLLPWTVRIYLGAGDESIRIVHTFVWDGDEQRDFVRGLGMRFEVPMDDEAYDRHIRFAGPERGIWGEPVRVLSGLGTDAGEAVRSAQIAGTATPPLSEWPTKVRETHPTLPLWNDFTLVQNSATQCGVWKRTSARSSWLKHAGFADRAPGFGFVGGISGGLGFGLREFWQQFPRAFDIRDAATKTATVTLWSWSPHAGAMDLRPYAHASHGMDLAYEDDRYGWGIPTGISRSTEMILWAFAATPSREQIADLAEAVATRPQIVANPETYHGAGVFGRWSLPNRSTPGRRELEDSIASDVQLYAGQVEQRQWYGFWDHGDVMHAYDLSRHTWRYDIGGFAWDNAELGTDGALWYAFLRSGDPATFRLAQAMTRHVSEADTHHIGPFAGLGSRHNVQHWGDGSKEARIAEAYTRRFLHYLTADDLAGDWLRVGLQADKTLVKYPPLRDYKDVPDGVATVVRIGPDWFALVSNWLAEWERTGDTRWRDRIITGMRDIAALPAGLFSGDQGGAVGFDPKTAHITGIGGDFSGGRNLSMSFLGDQIMWELLELVDVPKFRERLLEFAQYGLASSSERKAHFGFDFNPGLFKGTYSRVTAWAGEQLDDATLRRRGWDQLLTDSRSKLWPKPVRVEGTAVFSPVDEVQDENFATNNAAQRILAIIALLEIAPNEAP